MADSENSRTLPAITHRNALPAAERFLLELAGDQEAAGNVDMTLAKWCDWIAAHREFARLCRVQQRLETQVLSVVSSPCVEIHIPSLNKPLIAGTEEEIESWLAGEDFADERDRAKQELVARRESWNAVDEFVGYSRAKAAETAASDRECSLLAELWTSPAVTMAAAAAKLHSIIAQGAPEADADDFPWPQARSVLVELMGMCPRSPASIRDP
ncbi:hypothetical protein [Rhizobium binxianense]